MANLIPSLDDVANTCSMVELVPYPELLLSDGTLNRSVSNSLDPVTRKRTFVLEDLNVVPFQTRADFEATDVPAELINFTAAGLSYTRDVAGTAITSANLITASPNGDVTPEHWGTPVTDVELTAAAAYAFANDRNLQLEDTYTSTASIPLLHDVNKVGAGKVVVGANEMSVALDQSNIEIFVDIGGDDLNDGLAAGPTRAVRTLTRAHDIIKSLGDHVVDVFTITMSAGTFTDVIDWSLLSSLTKRITINGATAGHPNLPTTVFNGSATDTIFKLGLETRLLIRDVLFTGATSGLAMNVNGGYLTLVNVHTRGIWKGVINQHNGFVAFTGGIIDGGIGYTAFYGATHDSGANSIAEGTIFRNYIGGPSRGMQIGEGSQGHLDYITLETNNIGMDIKRGAGAVNTRQMLIQRNDVGLLAQNNGWYKNGIDFATGVNANLINVRTYGGSPEFNYNTQDNVFRTMRTKDDSFIAQTAIAVTAAEQTIFTVPIEDWMISEGGHQIEFVCDLSTVLTGDLIFEVRIFESAGGASGRLGRVVIPAGTTDTQIVSNIAWTGVGAQRGTMRAFTNGGVVLMDNDSRAINLFNNQGEFRVNVTGTAADTVAAFHMRYSSTLGG